MFTHIRITNITQTYGENTTQALQKNHKLKTTPALSSSKTKRSNTKKNIANAYNKQFTNMVKQHTKNIDRAVSKLKVHTITLNTLLVPRNDKTKY